MSVRRRVGERDGRPLHSDVLGVLEEVTDTTLFVRRKDGTLVDIPVDQVTAARRVSSLPPRHRPRSAADWLDVDIERVAWQGWPGLEQERLGAWVLRAAGGFTGRANSALPLGDPGVPRASAIAHVRDFYALRGLRPRFQVPTPVAADLDGHLADLGWDLVDLVDVLTADVERVLTGTPPVEGVPEVVLDAEPDDAWLQQYHYRGGPLPEQARDVLLAGTGPVFASVRDAHGDALAIARGAVGGGWVGITAVEVDERARRRGLGTHVMRELLGWAGRQGARHAYLQVAHDNLPAQSVYGRMGFVRHHGYHYRLAPRA
ncbi:MAG TPA: GNAT family N-acetyltransferase [Candidatus Limnocylindria bacterium]|nr:GNAT family N-acetyltransferase [Candidatus Limnocylindria bacterium]